MGPFVSPFANPLWVLCKSFVSPFVNPFAKPKRSNFTKPSGYEGRLVTSWVHESFCESFVGPFVNPFVSPFANPFVNPL